MVTAILWRLSALLFLIHSLSFILTRPPYPFLVYIFTRRFARYYQVKATKLRYAAPLMRFSYFRDDKDGVSRNTECVSSTNDVAAVRRPAANAPTKRDPHGAHSQPYNRSSRTGLTYPVRPRNGTGFCHIRSEHTFQT